MTIADTLPYPKIKSLFFRDPVTHMVLEGQYRSPCIQMLSGMPWIFTEKIHGMNIRVHFDSKENVVLFGGRTNKANLPGPLLTKLKEMFKPVMFRDAEIDYDMTLYGEGFGMGIQKGGSDYIPDGVSFVLFDVRCNDYWLGWQDINDVARKLSVDCVKAYGLGDLQDLVGFVQQGFPSAYGPNVKVEGIVARPVEELRNRYGERIIVKLKGADFTEGQFS